MKRNMRDTVVSDQQIENELQRTLMKSRRLTAFRTMVSTILVTTALLVLATSLWFPIYRVTEEAGETDQKREYVVAAYKTKKLTVGDIAVLHQNDRIQMKRVIGLPGDWIYIDDKGNISSNHDSPGEEYVVQPVLDATALTYPYQVPEDCYIVTDTHAYTSTDSKAASVECVTKEKVAGKILFCIWPLQQAGFIG